MAKFLQILLLFLLIPITAFTQKESPNILVGETAEYRIEEFTLPGGQLGNVIFCMVQGPYGYMWFGSQSGLHRYDGQEFVTFKKSEEDTLDITTSLTHPAVKYLLWDHLDHLWVCTFTDGLYRFNPATEQFRHFEHDPDDPNSLSHNRIWCAAEDAEGNLWFGTIQGLNRFDRKTERFERFLPDPSRPGSLSHPYVMNIYPDKQNTLWIATGIPYESPEAGGLNRYDSATNSFEIFYHDPQDSTSVWTNAVRGMLEDSRGQFWVATAAGLQKMDRKKGTFKNMYYHPYKPHTPGAKDFETPMAFSLMEDRKGGLWVGTLRLNDSLSQLLRYDHLSSTAEYFPVTIAVWQIYESRDGTIWVTGADKPNSQKVLKITPKAESYDLQQGTHLFEDFKKTSLYQKLKGSDSEDRWVGPLSMTSNPADGTIWAEYLYDVRKQQNYVHYPLLVNVDQNSGISQFYYLKDLNLEHINSSPYFGNNSPDWAATGMAVDKNGNIWGSYPSDSVGVFCFNPETNQTKNYVHNPRDPNSLPSNLVVRMIKDKDGEIWTAHDGQGLACLNPTTGNWIHYFLEAEPSHQIGGNFPTALIEDQEGKIWVGGTKTGALRFITVIDKKSDKSHDYWNGVMGTLRFFAHHDDKIVFAQDGSGLGVINLEKPNQPVTWFNSIENNFPIDKAASIVFDKEGILWVSSFDRSLFVRLDIDKKSWFSFKNERDATPSSRTGMLGNDGSVYFSNEDRNGWTRISPKEFSNNQSDSLKLSLTELTVMGEKQMPGKKGLITNHISNTTELVLPHHAKSFGFRFSGFMFNSPITYQYRLFPHERDWKVTKYPTVNYSNIPAGTYQIQVQAYTKNGLSENHGINLSVVLLPPWWKSWWAYTLYVLTLISLMAGIFLYQRRRWQMQTRLQIEQERANRLKELDQFKSRFYTNITHEFRTPLTVIKGMAGQISGNEKIKTIIGRNSDRLLNMVNQLLDLSKLETNSLSINWVRGDIIPYLQYLTESCHSLAENKNLNLAFFSKEESLVMDFDETKMQHVLINLLSNAIKFTPKYGSVKVIAEQVLENGSPYLQLTVKDTGRGIPSEKLPHIFDRFYQVDNSATRSGEGSGIGLALVKELVYLLDGRINVESEAGKGSSFLVQLPIHQNALESTTMDTPMRSISIIEDSSVVNSPIPTSTTTNGEKPLVLIVEDNADVAEYIISCLQEEYSLDTAHNGKEGMDKALESIPDVILCDVMMPEMDGFEVCQQLKSDRLTSHVPIILLTAKATQEDKVTGLAHGADAYLTKPFDKEELLVRLRNLAAQSKRLKERLSESTNDSEQADDRENKEAAFLKELNQIIESNMANELFNTNYLCREIAMSRTQLHRKLKALTDESTANYIRSIRLRKAKSLLEKSDLPIGEIALQVGYKDFSHFSRSFFKEFGIQPSATRS